MQTRADRIGVIVLIFLLACATAVGHVYTTQPPHRTLRALATPSIVLDVEKVETVLYSHDSSIRSEVYSLGVHGIRNDVVGLIRTESAPLKRRIRFTPSEKGSSWFIGLGIWAREEIPGEYEVLP